LETLKVTRVPIGSLRMDPANARLHGDANLDAIAGSLARFGQAEPLVVQRGTNRVIAGNGRPAAMNLDAGEPLGGTRPVSPRLSPLARD
jgi:ParB-like chromosome segregation protein Spo0J